MPTVLYENDYYKVVTAPTDCQVPPGAEDPHHPQHYNYLLVNKVSFLIEGKFHALAQAVYLATEHNTQLLEVLGKRPSHLTVV